VFTDGSVLEAFVDERVVLTCRAYDFSEGAVGVFADHGSARFDDVAAAPFAS